VNFAGYPRKSGAFGVRNIVLVFPTTGCSSVVAQRISQSVHGTVYVTHAHGCGHLGIDKEHMIRTMSGFCSNPNVAGVLLVGLGCEVLTPEVIAEELRKVGQRFEILSIQDQGGTTGAIEKGKALVAKLLLDAEKEKRKTIDIRELVLGAKCGGSDTFSGLTANPALGVASDLLISQGGTVLLGEVPEMLGAEQILIKHAANDEVKQRICQVTSEMEASILKMGVDVRGSEPSQGNIAGGLTTLEEKSLGAIRKGGTSVIKQVVSFAEKPTEKGLIIMDGPALDPICVTGFCAAGAQIVVFTTGRGTPLGSAIAPVIKLASNSLIYQRMKDNIDMNAGQILDGEQTIQSMGELIFKEIIEVSSGKATRSEILGHNEFAIHLLGPAV
jgi:altronate dehydratase large subunit